MGASPLLRRDFGFPALTPSTGPLGALGQVGPPGVSGEAGGPDHATAHLGCHRETGFNARKVLELLCVLFAS